MNPQAPTPTPTPPSSGLRGMGRTILINLGILALYMIPAYLVISLGPKLDNEVAVAIAFFGPVAHAALTLVGGLVILIATPNKNRGASLMISGMIVGIVGFSTCLGFLASGLAP